MQAKLPCLALVVLTLSGCAATTPPPRFQAVGPADPDGPESASPPAAPVLMVAPAAKASPTPTPTPAPHHHGGPR